VSSGKDRAGGWVGILTFLVGVAMLTVTFTIAYGLFQVPPEKALDLKPDQPLNVNDTGRAMIGLLFRIAMLLVMCWVGAVIANRGIKLYASGRPDVKDPSEPVKKENSDAA